MSDKQLRLEDLHIGMKVKFKDKYAKPMTIDWLTLHVIGFEEQGGIDSSDVSVLEIVSTTAIPCVNTRCMHVTGCPFNETADPKVYCKEYMDNK